MVSTEIIDYLLPGEGSFSGLNNKKSKDKPTFRLAPSPTGQVHLGTLYIGLINLKIAQKMGANFILRIEDTDTSREVAGAANYLIRKLADFGINFTESPLIPGINAPYFQSMRSGLYINVARELLASGNAYPCFMTKDELDEHRSNQLKLGRQTGLYKGDSYWREVWESGEFELVFNALQNGKPFFVCFANNASEGSTVFDDYFLGRTALATIIRDEVILKSPNQNGLRLPTYHFAHIVDDTAMGTTHVLRGIDWIQSTALHLQMFNQFGFTPPIYGHLPTIDKLEGEKRRKLSKRKDAEASLSYFEGEGFPKDVIIEYLLTIANSSFEKWRKQNPEKSCWKYELNEKELGRKQGPLLDLKKIISISKEYIANLSVENLFKLIVTWAQEFDEFVYKVITTNEPYSLRVLSIGKSLGKSRKDLSKFSEFKCIYGMFFDEIYFSAELDFSEIPLSNENILGLISQYFEILKMACELEKTEWLDHVKIPLESNKIAASSVEFKQNAGSYVCDLSTLMGLFRWSMIGRINAPDLYEILNVLGPERIEKRLNYLKNKYLNIL
jgi:glutamyl-tRNA synthetase